MQHTYLKRFKENLECFLHFISWKEQQRKGGGVSTREKRSGGRNVSKVAREEGEQVKILTSKKISTNGHQEKVLIGRKYCYCLCNCTSFERKAVKKSRWLEEETQT